MRVPESVDAGLDRDGPGRGAICCGIRHVSRLVVAKKAVACRDRVTEMRWPTRWPDSLVSFAGLAAEPVTHAFCVVAVRAVLATSAGAGRHPRCAAPGVVTYVYPSDRSHITVPSDWWDGPEIRNKGLGSRARSRQRVSDESAAGVHLEGEHPCRNGRIVVHDRDSLVDRPDERPDAKDL
jgi:hypothetical protein